MKINFECKKCGNVFDCEVGEITFPENSDRPNFEKEIICPKCGQLSMDEVFLTELGQSQLTEATIDFEVEDIFDFEDDDLNDFGLYEGECQGCDIIQPVNDLGLCEECNGKLERDMIRQRNWAYSALAFGCPEPKLEELRKEVIQQYGTKLELIAPTKGNQKKKKNKKRKKRRSGTRR